MSLSSIFIHRPVATTLLAAGIALAGISAFMLLPVSPNPNIDLPTISVSATMAGASPETMSTTVATPLERHLGSISAVNEMTSTSTVGSTRVILQFDINRDIDGAARDVQAAISAARVDLPAALRSNPTYRKVNPADLPIMTFAMTSKTLTPGQIYDQASNLVQQKLSQVTGVGEVDVNGSSLPAVRIELNPTALFKYGIGLEDVRAAVSAANANSPKGTINQGPQGFEVHANDSATNAAAYRTLIVAYRDNAAVRLDDLGTVSDDVENVRNFGYANGQLAVLVTVTKMPGANVINVADRLRALLPEMRAELPKSVDLSVINDSTISIRNSLHDVEWTLVIATICVIFVVFIFLRNFRASLVPSIAVPLSLLGTFGVMYLFGFSLDNFSLMALVVSTGFVVDDAIVMLENITRHRENGETLLNAALAGASEVSFTVLSMSMSLVAVFIPVLLLGGIVGRLFHEFALTVTIAIMISLVISLTVTPMMSAYILTKDKDEDRENSLMDKSRRIFDAAHRFYGRTLRWALDNPQTIIFILFVTICLNFYLFAIIPKGFFPVQDEGRMQGGVRADQSISFQLLEKKFLEFADIIRSDPAVASSGGYAGGGGSNTGFFFVTLKPPSQRGGMSTDEVIARLRPKLNSVAGAQLFLQAAQQIRTGGRASFASYQYTLQGDSLTELNQWIPKITAALQNVPELDDVNSDQQSKGLEVDLKVDRATAMRLGINPTNIDNTLYDAFGQRAVSTIYEEKNQYEVIMEVAPQFWQSPDTLKDIYVSTSGGAVSGTQSTAPAAGTFNTSDTTSGATSAAGTAATLTGASSTVAQTAGSSTTTLTTASSTTTSSPAASSGSNNGQNNSSASNNAELNAQLNALTNSGRGGASTGSSLSTTLETMIPLSAFSHYVTGTTPLAVNHQGVFVATTISFNLPEGESLSVATAAINRAIAQLHVPISIHGVFAGTASLFQRTLGGEPILILSAIITIYIVLGILYESYVHPLTILSTLPSAGVGAVLALLIFKMDFSLIALIGVLLLIGFVKKNAIIMIDFAIDGQTRMNLTPREAIYRACLLRFRPIMMTTMAAILGGMPLAFGLGEGYELRQPLGISIVGGLILSQTLTLYTTPVVYLYLDSWRLRCQRIWERWYNGAMGDDGSKGAQPAE